MKKKVRNLSFLLFVVLIMALSIWGPEALAKYKDRAILDETHEQTVESASEGYRYTLNSNEKLYILSRCLNSQSLPESEQNALTRKEAENVDFPDLEGAYAFVVNHRGPSGKEITSEEIYEACNKGLEMLKELDILPHGVRRWTRHLMTPPCIPPLMCRSLRIMWRSGK